MSEIVTPEGRAKDAALMLVNQIGEPDENYKKTT